MRTRCLGALAVIEQVSPKAVLRSLSVEEPFAEPGEGRQPTPTRPRQISIEGEPAEVAAIAPAYSDWLGTSSVPKLFVKTELGAILASDAMVDFVRGWPAQAEVAVAGVHFLQEDSADEIGRAIAGWMEALG
jgi:haloalkane dehalogenase